MYSYEPVLGYRDMVLHYNILCDGNTIYQTAMTPLAVIGGVALLNDGSIEYNNTIGAFCIEGELYDGFAEAINSLAIEYRHVGISDVLAPGIAAWRAMLADQPAPDAGENEGE